MGCVRLKVEDAKWIYDNCIPGTKVEFYSEQNPGPLGRPTAQKITADEEVRNWDPTDPDQNNPWAEYLKKKQEEQNAKPPKVETEKDEIQDNTGNTNTNTNTNTDTNTSPDKNSNVNTNTNADTNTSDNTNNNAINRFKEE